jgi:hypothetical protein
LSEKRLAKKQKEKAAKAQRVAKASALALLEQT